jgi:hypothetical protein
MQKGLPRPLPRTRSRSIVFVLLALNAADQTGGQTPFPAPAACALSGQLGGPRRVDRTEVELVSNPEPVSVAGLKLDTTISIVARVVSLSPLFVEILDSDLNQPADAHLCQIMRLFSVDARLRPALGALRFNDVVEGKLKYSPERGILTDLRKIQGAPTFFHDREHSACDNRTGTLLAYQSRSGEYLVLYNDLTISYRDHRGKLFDRQKLGPESLNRLMQSFKDAGFNAFPARKWDNGLATQSPITLVCGRYQKVLSEDHVTALTPVLRNLEDVRAAALANTYFMLSYKEKLEITFVDWPLPNTPPDQVGDWKGSALQEQRDLATNRPTENRFGFFQQRLPPGFLDKLAQDSIFQPQANAAQVYVKMGSRVFRLRRDPGVAPANAGTLYELVVQEVMPTEKGFVKSPPGVSEPACASAGGPAGLLWPSGAGVELQQVPANGLAVSNEEYARQPLYERIFNSCSSAGFDFVEGRYLYKNVQVTRLERDSH